MLLAVDASVLVAEFLRVRGRELFADLRLRPVVTEEQWDEFQHELERRLSVIVRQHQLDAQQATLLREPIERLIARNVIEVIPRHDYDALEEIARRRVPRDPGDWPVVALAIALNAGILTEDHDFLGCGCPTWTVETLRSELEAGDVPRS
jgi:predicted nucleic acid-binding protein